MTVFGNKEKGQGSLVYISFYVFFFYFVLRYV